MQAHTRTMLCEFGGNREIRPREEAIFVANQKCLYHVTLDIERALEHTPGAGQSGDDFVQLWYRSKNLHARKSDFRDMTKVPVSRVL